MKIEVFSSREDRDYQDHLLKEIHAVRSRILLVGEGPPGEDPESQECSSALAAALRGALARGVRITYSMTRPRATAAWVERLATLMEEYPEHLTVRVPRAGARVHSFRGSLLDPEGENPVVELRVTDGEGSAPGFPGRPGTTVFIDGSPELARNLLTELDAALEDERSQLLEDAATAHRVLIGRECYFAFGSNLLAKQMLERCPSASSLGVAVLADHELCFDRRGSFRPGGVANLREKTGARVYGLVWELDWSDLQALDAIERSYRRETVTLRFLDGAPTRGHVYRATSEGDIDPDEDYLRRILQGAEEAGLPAPYLHSLRARLAGLR